jgi:hypothetical protein
LISIKKASTTGIKQLIGRRCRMGKKELLDLTGKTILSEEEMSSWCMLTRTHPHTATNAAHIMLMKELHGQQWVNL